MGKTYINPLILVSQIKVELKSSSGIKIFLHNILFEVNLQRYNCIDNFV